MAAKKKTTPIKKNGKKKPADEVIISAPREPITKTVNSDSKDSKAISGVSTEEPIPPTEKAQIDIFTPEFCASLWEMLFSRLAETRGEHWKLNDAEKLTIGETTAVVANKYIAELLGDYPELAALGISVVVITAPKVLKDGKIKRAAKQLADGSIQKVGSGKDVSVSSVLTDKEQPGSGSGEKPSTN